MTEDGTEDAAGQPAAAAAETPKSVPSSANQTGGDIHKYLGARLRQAFDDIAQQPVPDRFLDLMRQLDRS